MKIYGCIEDNDEDDYLNACRRVHENYLPCDYQIELMNNIGGMWMVVFDE